MDTRFEQKIKLLSSQIDQQTKLGLIPSLTVVQDNMCEYYKNISCDGIQMIPSHNCFFVVTKTRLRILNKPNWLDEIVMSTDVTKTSAVRMNLSTIIRKGNDISVVALQEMCAIDATTRKLRALNSTNYPLDVVFTSDDYGLTFDKLENDFIVEDNLVDSVTIKSTNIDFCAHTNNVEYVRYLLNTLPLDEILTRDFNDMQINYLVESRETDVLKIYRKDAPNGYIFAITKDDILILQAKIQHV